jgi:hypothetical protein
MDSIRADAEEAMLTYRPDSINTYAPDDLTAQKLENVRRIGLDVQEGAHVSVHGNILFRRVVPDAFVFCASELPPNPKLVRLFGRHCVKISIVPAFWVAVTTALKQKFDLAEADFGRVQYRGRSFQHADVVDPVMFVGPEPNREEAEVRFYWTVDGGIEITPMEVYSPRIAELVTLVPKQMS